MRNSLYVNLLVLLFLGFPIFSFRGENEHSGPSDSTVPWKPVFDSRFEKGLFRTTMDIGNNHLTGFIFIKKLDDSSYRVLFNNEIGMSIFDFGFLPDEFIVHSCFPSMNRKSLLKLFETDFRMLFYTDHGIQKIIPEKPGPQNERIYKFRSENGTWMCKVSDSSNMVTHIGSLNKFISRTRIQIMHSEGNISSIAISNPTIRLSILMKLISP